MDQPLEAESGAQSVPWESFVLPPCRPVTPMYDLVRGTVPHRDWIQVRGGRGRGCNVGLGTHIWGLAVCSVGLPGAGRLGQVWF